MPAILLVAAKGIIPSFTAEGIAQYLSFDKALDPTTLDGEILIDEIDIGITGINFTVFHYTSDPLVTDNVTLIIVGHGVDELNRDTISPVVLEVMRLLKFIPGVDDYSMYIQNGYIAYVFRHLSFPMDVVLTN